MRFKNERGFIFIGFALILAAVMMVLFNLTLNKTAQMMKRFGDGQSLFFTQSLSVRFGEQIRYSYDIARLVAADPVNNAYLCPAAKGAALVALKPTLKLCLVKKQICVLHPHDSRQICIGTGDGSLLASGNTGERSHENVALEWLLPKAHAQVDRPSDPAPGDTSNTLVTGPTCIDGTCASTCGVNADCVSFKFCPRTGSCDANQYVWQTVALIK